MNLSMRMLKMMHLRKKKLNEVEPEEPYKNKKYDKKEFVARKYGK